MIRRNMVEHHIQLALLEDNKIWIRDFDHVWIIGFSYQEPNKVADKLANYGKENLCLYQTFGYSPT